MASWKKLLWGGIGWSLGGPIGAILAYSFASMADGGNQAFTQSRPYKTTQPGDFGAALLILFAAVMKADGVQSKSELAYVKKFFVSQFGKAHAQERMQLFKEILKQDYSTAQVCAQIKSNMDHATRLQLVHILFGLSQADGHVHPDEVKLIGTMSRYLGISQKDFESIQAMFYKSTDGAYKILEIEASASDDEIKKAYRKMAIKYHPDKVQHLGDDFQKMAEEKFKALNEAYQQIKKERGL
ncbi:MAG: TerB family tellurite resistance protein [Candidatus Marinimicrobia bacterium]|nr:TerB family tellurite resistance protein [Candidatus Neomarinimicrobiota bacterium]